MKRNTGPCHTVSDCERLHENLTALRAKVDRMQEALEQLEDVMAGDPASAMHLGVVTWGLGKQ